MFLYLSDSAVLIPLVSIQLVIVFCLNTVKKKTHTQNINIYACVPSKRKYFWQHIYM